MRADQVRASRRVEWVRKQRVAGEGAGKGAGEFSKGYGGAYDHDCGCLF